MSFGVVLALVFVLILATTGLQINSGQQQVLLDIYSSCSPNCPSSISSSAGNCDFNSTSANQCSCSNYISCNPNGDITELFLYFTFYTINHKHKPKTKTKKKKRIGIGLTGTIPTQIGLLTSLNYLYVYFFYLYTTHVSFHYYI